jgi:hypothetical protein
VDGRTSERKSFRPRRDPSGARVRVRLGRSALRDALIVLILVMAGIFDWLSGNPIHSILLFAAAAAVAWEAARPNRRGQGGPTARSATVGGVSGRIATAAGLAFAVIVGGFARYSWPATVAVVSVGAMAIAATWRRPVPEGPEQAKLDTVGSAVWVTPFLALGLLELTNLLLQPSLKADSYAHPTLSVLTDPILASHPGRSVALLMWLAVGWFLVKR